MLCDNCEDPAEYQMSIPGETRLFMTCRDHVEETVKAILQGGTQVMVIVRWRGND